MTDEDWDQEPRALPRLSAATRASCSTPTGGRQRAQDDDFLLLFNAHHEPIPFTLPGVGVGKPGEAVIDTADTDAKGQCAASAASTYPLQGRSLVVLIRREAPILPTKGEGAAETMPAPSCRPPLGSSAPRGVLAERRRACASASGPAPPGEGRHRASDSGRRASGRSASPAGPRPAPADAAARWRLARGRRPGRSRRAAIASRIDERPGGARPGLAPQPGRRARPERGRRPAAASTGTTRLARPALARGGALRAARRHLHAGGHLRRRERHASTTWPSSASPRSS